MRQRLLICLLLIAGGIYVFPKIPGNEDVLQKFISRLTSAADEPSQTSRIAVPVLDVPPEKMRTASREASRLRPDARFLLAVSEVHSLLSGKPKKPATAEFENGAWVIRHGGGRVGTLTEYPDFSDAIDLLTHWARVTAWDHPFCLDWEGTNTKPFPNFIESYWCRLPWLRPKNHSTPEQLGSITSRLGRFWAPDVAVAAREADSLWRNGIRDAPLLKAMARALVYLNLQELDRMEIGDHLSAKALAVLTLTKALSGLPVAHEETLLAEIMGYSEHAQRLTETLPDDDPVKWYTRQEDTRLAKIAEDNQSTVEARYLHLLRLATQKDSEKFLSGLRSMFPGEWLSLPIFKAGLEMHGFAIARNLSEALPRMVLLAIAQEVGLPSLTAIMNKARSKEYSDTELTSLTRSVQTILNAETSTVLKQFEEGLHTLDSHYPGPFLDSQTYQTYFRAHLFSGLYVLGIHYLDNLSSAEAVNAFADLLGTPESGIASAFTVWYRHLAVSESGSSDPTSFFQDIDNMKLLTAPLLMRSFEEVATLAPFPDPHRQNALLVLFNRLDSRAEHRRFLSKATVETLADLALAERLHRSLLVIDATHHRDLQAMYLYYASESVLLGALSRSSHIGPTGRTEILTYLEKLGADQGTIREGYDQLVAQFPDRWGIRNSYMKYLERTKQFQSARKVGEDWLAREVATVGLEHIETQTEIARMFYLEGRYEEGLKAIKPIIPSMKGSTLLTAALLLEKLQSHQDAEQMAMTCVKRYPSSVHCRATLAEFYWRHEKPDEAARILKGASHPLNVTDWETVVSPKFYDVFKDETAKEILAVYAIMLAQGIDQLNLHRLAFPFAEHRRYDVAYELVSRLSLTPSFFIYAYSYLKQAKDKDEALAWLRKQIPVGLFVPASRVFYAEHQDDLLWEFAPLSDHQRGADEVWLLRAAAWVRGQAQDIGHREALFAHYNRVRPGLHHTLGRILLELSPEEDVLVYATDAQNRCQIGYYLGLRAQNKGRYDDASDWYLVALQTQQTGLTEHNLASHVLGKWSKQEKYLQQLADIKS